MENMFIVENEKYAFTHIGYRESREVRKFFQQEITTEEEYIDWVREWKKIEKQLTFASRFFRFQKNKNLKKNNGVETDEIAVNYMRYCKLCIRVIAREAYYARVENKKLLKSGVLTPLVKLNSQNKELSHVV